MTKTFEITANGTLMGEYNGINENAVIDAYAKDAGYKDFADCIDQVGASKDELEVSEIDIDKLVTAVESKAGVTVFQDSYGSGVAMVSGTSYATYRDLADAFGLDIDKFHA